MKEFNPLVSIIIPVYNGENYVKEAIDSALAQTYKNIEIIVVNDGSKDNTEKICKSYKNKIRYIKKENGGVASALNLAIKNMKGEYFSWLSHDDLYFPNKVEAQINFLKSQNNKEVILYSDYAIINERGELTALCKKDHKELQKKPLYSLLTGAVNGITMLIPKVCFEKVGNFNEKLRCTQDYDLWFKFFDKYNFVHIEKILSSTRIHSQQDSQVSPNVIKEGNQLWLNMIKTSEEKYIQNVENTKYEFYIRILNCVKDTSYDKVIEYLARNIKAIENNAKNKIKIQKTKVSVIIPFFNRINMTIRAIKSVENQTYQNYEIILINDASTDNIKKIEDYISQNPKIKLYTNKKNLGPSGSRNYGIDKATGEYIAFLDSDDVFKKNKIEKQLHLMLLYNSLASYTNYEEKLGKQVARKNCYTIKNDDINEFFFNCKLATPTIMVQTEYLKKYNIRYIEKFKVCEDACFYLDILKNTDFLYVDKYLTEVNVNKSSCINDYNKRIQGLNNILKYSYEDEYYKNICQEEREIIMDGIINFTYLNRPKEKNVSIGRKIYRRLPLDFRKKVKNYLKTRNIKIEFEK